MPSGLEYRVHPLSLMTVSDHHVRTKAQNGDAKGVAGVLLGQQTNRTVRLMNAFEALVGDNGGVDVAFLKDKMDMYRKVFPKLDVVGFYATGQDVDAASAKAMYRALLEVTESPVLLLMDVAIQPDAKQTAKLPVKLFETEMRGGDVAFVEVPVALESEEAERVAVDEVSRVASAAGGAGGDGTTAQPSSADQLRSHLHTTHSATEMLGNNVEKLLAFVRDVQARSASNGRVEPHEHAALRDITALCRQLPASATAAHAGFAEEFRRDTEDVALVAHLTAVTKGISRAVDVGAKLGVLGTG